MKHNSYYNLSDKTYWLYIEPLMTIALCSYKILGPIRIAIINIFTGPGFP